MHRIVAEVIHVPDLKTLRQGDTGPQVELLQLALERAEFGPGAPDGIFGQKTADAVRRFQLSNGLKADGIAGSATWRALQPYLYGYRSHTVRRGDSFYKIAHMYGTSLRAVEAANPGIDPFALIPGSVLKIPLPFPVVPTRIRFTSDVLYYVIHGLSARFPYIAIETAGHSVMGKPLYACRIGTGKKQVFYNGTHHANEWIVTPVLLQFLEQYAAALNTGSTIGGADASALYQDTTLYMMPMVDPDGVDLVTGALNSGRYYQQASAIARDYPQISFPDGWKANIDGIDLNLQYPAGWEQAREIKFSQGFVSPAPRDYVGAAPLEAPESRAVYEFTLRHNFLLTLSYHTQGKVIYWKYLDYEPLNAEEIGRAFAEVSGYELAETPYASSFAGYKDWFIAQYVRPGYTIEAGLGTAPLPLSQFDEIYRDNLGILVGGMTAAL